MYLFEFALFCNFVRKSFRSHNSLHSVNGLSTASSQACPFLTTKQISFFQGWIPLRKEAKLKKAGSFSWKCIHVIVVSILITMFPRWISGTISIVAHIWHRSPSLCISSPSDVQIHLHGRSLSWKCYLLYSELLLKKNFLPTESLTWRKCFAPKSLNLSLKG